MARGTRGIEPRRGTEKPKNYEWTRMGTNKIFKTTKHTKNTGTEDGVELEPRMDKKGHE